MQLPKNMQVIQIDKPGGPEVLQLATAPIVHPNANEVLIKVAAAGVNRPDVMQRKGHYPAPPGASEVLGLEISGEIVIIKDENGNSVEQHANGLKLGDRVCALVAGGGYAQYCTAPIEQCLPIPQGFDYIQAAAIPETFFTVWSNVFDRAGLKPGETLLVHGGSSGIGTTAVQLATALGSKVYATAGSDEKSTAVRELGAIDCFNYKTQDFVEEIKNATNGVGVNVILDMVAGSYVNRNLKALADDGRAVIIALQGGSKDEINLIPILMRRLTLTGSTLRQRPVEFKAQIANALKQKVWPLFENNTIKPIIHSVFNLKDANQAHALMDSSQHIGKIVLQID